jgi:hypothetical protein
VFQLTAASVTSPTLAQIAPRNGLFRSLSSAARFTDPLLELEPEDLEALLGSHEEQGSSPDCLMDLGEIADGLILCETCPEFCFDQHPWMAIHDADEIRTCSGLPGYL